MYSTFFGLELANRALSSYQAALDVTGHNIANANTKGYTRQLANIQAGKPLSIQVLGKQLTLGTGSTMDNVIRARDYYVDRQFRWETSKYEYWVSKEKALNMVEGLMNEPSEYSLHDDLDKFWNAWSELAKNPQNMGARSVLRERAITLVDTLHHIDQQITDLQSDLDASVEVTVKQINTIANQIKELNTQIKRAEVSLDNPNDLKDQRDALVDELAKLVPVRVVETQDPGFTDRSVGVYKIIIGNDADPNNVLVDDQVVRHLQDPAPEVSGFSRVVWEGLDAGDSANWADLGTAMGKLQADIEMRDEYLVAFRSQFDTLANGIANAVNVIHKMGQGLEPETAMNADGPVGIDFFTTSTGTFTAASITINSVIMGDVDRIATGKIPLDTSTVPPTHAKDTDGNDLVEVGDGSIALAIASLAQGWYSIKTQIDNDVFGAGGAKPVNAASFGDFYGAVIAQMGVDVQQCKRMSEGQSVLVTHMNNQRESMSGVSLDEEMANLVKFQKSYSAAARIVTMIDSMLEKILAMGVTR